MVDPEAEQEATPVIDPSQGFKMPDGSPDKEFQSVVTINTAIELLKRGHFTVNDLGTLKFVLNFFQALLERHLDDKALLARHPELDFKLQEAVTRKVQESDNAEEN